jgi:hypothetical protein
LKFRKQTPYRIRTAVSDFFLFLDRMASGSTYDQQARVFGDPRPEFNLHESFFCHAFHRVAAAMQAFLPSRLCKPIDEVLMANRHGFKGFDQRIYLAIDGTHVRIDRPYQPPGMSWSHYWALQKLYYDFKHSCFSLKILLCCDVQARIVFISRVYTGATHDMKVFKECGIIDWAKYHGLELLFLADKGYISAEFSHRLVTPKREPRRIRGEARRALPAEDAARNRWINSERIEHLNAKAKEAFRALNTGNMEGNRDLAATVFLSAACFTMVYSWEVQHESH